MKKHLFTILAFALGLILNAQVCLNPTAGSPFSLAQQPFAITSADFNGDGKADLATADRNNSTVSVLLGDGVGSFTTTTSFTVGSFPNSITNADFNADGKIDLATTNNGSSNVSILLGDGTGNFTATTSISVGSAPSSITKGDFNMDSKVDLAIANNSSNTISILLGNGLGGFAAAVNFNTGTGPISVISADFNSDSKLDLGVANATSNNVSILLGNGAGSFSTAVNFSAGTFPRSIINGDFNADGKVDLATANDQSNNVSVLIGDGTGNFAPSVLYTVGTNPYAVTSADFNSDGKADLATANVNSNNISVLLGNGAGTFSPAVNIGVGSVVRSVISVDFNSDGRDDIISANFSSLSIFLNQTPVITANATATVVCSGTNITLTGGGAVTYTWTGGVSDGVAFIPTSTTTYTVTGTDGNGCTNAAIKTITVNPLPIANAGIDQTLTCSSTTVTLAGSTSPSSCTPVWTGGVSSGVNSYNAIASNIGTYTLTVTDPGSGCSSSDQVLVSPNLSIPTITISVSNALTCLTATATLTASTSAALPTYAWVGPNVVSGGTTPNPTVDQSGIYTVTVTDIPTGCSNTATTIVTQNTISPSVTGGVTGTLTCFASTVDAISSTTIVPASYSWSGIGIISGGTTPTITVNQSGVFNYTVTNSSNGCTSTGTRIVSQNTVSPSGVNAGMDQLLTCSTATVTLSGSVFSPTNATFNWTGGVCGTATNSITSACSPGFYTLTVTDPINGCNGTDIMQVTANVAIPTVTLSSNSATLTCSSTTVSITSTTTTTPVSYSWSPASGIVGGSGSTNTPYFNAPGSYSLVVTDLINGCSTNISSNVVNVSQNIFIPSITISASPSVICSGNSSTLTAFAGSDIDYNWLPGALNGPVQTVSPNATTSYTVVTTNTITGCANSETITLTVNATPTISISGNTLICKGSTSTLTGSGATSYTWNSGANTSTINVTPTITTTYTLSGDNGNGCFNSIPTTISIIPNKTISGVITSTTGATSGDLILYKYTSGLSMWDSITTVPLSSSYSFASIDSSLYVIRAIPTATNIQVTYADSATTWQNATVINHGCTNNTSQNIKLIPLDNLGGGPGILTGFIIEDDGFGARMSNEFKPLAPGNPIGGIVVKGGRNPGGNMFTQTTTDATGGYTLTNIPLNTGSDHYFIYVDIPGLDTSASYHKVITTTNTLYQNLNWSVDSMYIKPIGEITTIKNNHSLLNNIISVFPNPASNYVTIQYELVQSADIQITLYNIIGNKVQDIESSGYHNKNKYNHILKTDHLSSGIYFIKVSIDGSENTIKLIVSN